MSVRERLKAFIHYRGLSVRAFESQVGLGNGYVNNISRSISLNKLNKIKTEFPDINLSWLTLGEGEMIHADIIKNIAGADGYIKPPYTKELADVINRIAQFVFAEDRDVHLTTDALKGFQFMLIDYLASPNPNAKNIAERFFALNPNVNKEWLLSGIGTYLNAETVKDRRSLIKTVSASKYSKEKFKKVGATEIAMVEPDAYIVTTPLVGIAKYNDFINQFNEEEFLTSLPRHSVMLKSVALIDYISFEISNDEMVDESGYGYNQGSVIFCNLMSLGKLLNSGRSKNESKTGELPIHLSPNNDVVIVIDNSLLIRQVKFHDLKSNTMLLSSLNRNKLLFPDQIIRLENVKSIYQIVGKTD